MAAGGDRGKVEKSHDARSHPAREALRRQADTLFFPELWRRMAARNDEQMNAHRVPFLEDLAQRARSEFSQALPAIPCAALMRPRAETRGRQALERGLHAAVRKLKVHEMAHVAT